MALVLVLASLVLLATLVVAFLLGVGRERKASANHQATVTTRKLGEMAVNLVEAQITAATTSGSGNAWASQPGAIWTWNDTGSVSGIYRLYSWDSLKTADPVDVVTRDPAGMTGWADSPAVWADLNAPGAGGAYPIVDPLLSGSVDGFGITNPPGGGTGAPMPVKWIYVLQDGTLVPPPAGSGGKVIPVSGASPGNPIVGRIAYWTDDETCKVNINTAGGDDGGTVPPMSNGVITDYSSLANATFWDTPHFGAADDINRFAMNQPTTGEYQRYAGHPATTGLNHLISSLMGTALNSADFFSLTPRYGDGGSAGGTKPVSESGPIPLKADRLYASVEELLFSSTNRNPSAINTVPGAALSQAAARADFFLSVHSRAPELNLFGEPRVSLWPVYSTGQALASTSPVPSDALHMTALDKLLAFCSTVTSGSSAFPYYFVRKDPASSSVDVNISRNQSLLGYLDRLTSRQIPGFGGSFQDVAKYGRAGARQILTEIFDYIRIINLADPTLPAAANPPSNAYAAGAIKNAVGQGFSEIGQGQVTPTVSPVVEGTAWGTQGFGAFPRLVEADLQFVCMGNAANEIPGAQINNASVPYDPGVIVSNTATGNFTVTAPDKQAVQAFLLLNFINPAHAMPSPRNEPCFWVTISGLDNFKLDGNSLGFTSSASALAGAIKYNILTSNDLVGYTDFRSMVAWRQLSPGMATSGTAYPFYSKMVTTGTSGAMGFASTAPVTIEIRAPLHTNVAYASGNVPFGDVVQTYTIRFPDKSLPVPSLPNHRLVGALPYNGSPSGDRWTDGSGFGLLSVVSGTNSILEPNDTFAGMVLSGTWADARMLAVSGTVPVTAFVPHPKYGEQYGYGIAVPGLGLASGIASGGKLVAGANYYYSCWPLAPATVSGVTTWDWDNGISTFPDGPYINKTDEGNVYVQGGTKAPYYVWSQFAANGNFFSPSRQVPSPVVLGSLPTGVDPAGAAPKPWQTLLFRPGPAGHPGSTAPRDHLLLDLFWMPAAAPYAISEPFSTAGKVNLNYQIVPCTYISRSTALRAVLGSEKVAVVDKNSASTYKQPNQTAPTLISGNSRFPLNLGGDTGDDGGVLQQFRNRFEGRGGFAPSSTPSIFRSASGICDIYLVPKGDAWTTPATAQSEWYGDKFAMVGDNVRERPYANIYGRVTTKSNTYKVFYTVQSLKAGRADLAAGQWDESRGAITGQYRGSTTIERYIDSSSGSIPDPATNHAAESLEAHYRWRAVDNHQFIP